MNKLRTPITYYGGKQKLLKTVLELIPDHHLYAEPFIGGGAIYWAKPSSEVEVINDTNRELINFYEVCKNEFIDLEKKVRISLHSRSLHSDAFVVNSNPHMFSRIERAWAIWVLASQSFSSKLDGTFGYDRKTNTTSKKIHNKREAFTERYSIRLQNTQIENTDALRIIRSRDTPTSFFYCDPPYFNSNCGHYDGYSKEDFTQLLETLSTIEGKFLLSSYPSDILKEFKHKFNWHERTFKQRVSVSLTNKSKTKTEVMTANYPI